MSTEQGRKSYYRIHVLHLNAVFSVTNYDITLLLLGGITATLYYLSNREIHSIITFKAGRNPLTGNNENENKQFLEELDNRREAFAKIQFCVGYTYLK